MVLHRLTPCALLLATVSSTGLVAAPLAPRPSVLRLDVSRSESRPLRDGASSKTFSDRISMDFPEPTEIADVIRFVSLWSNQTFVIDRNVQGKVQILAPEPLPRAEALERFRAALAQLGLAESTFHGVTIIAPERILTPLHEDRRAALAAPDLPMTKELVRMDYPSPTSIRDVIHDVARWSHRTLVMDRNTNGTISIFSPRPMSKEHAYLTYLTALDLLGLTESARGSATQVVPIVIQAHQRPLHLDLPPSAGGAPVPLRYDHPTDIRAVLQDARSWYDRDLILDREVAGRVEILSAGPLDRQRAYEALAASLDILGLAMVEQGGAVAIKPLRDIPQD